MHPLPTHLKSMIRIRDLMPTSDVQQIKQSGGIKVNIDFDTTTK